MAVRNDFTAGEVLAAADLNDTFASKVDYATPTNAQAGTAYTFVADDAERITTASNGSAVTFTIPPQSSVGWVDDTILRVVNYGAGALTVAGGSGVTVTNTATVINQYGGGAAIRTGSDAWTFVPFGAGEAPFAATGGNEIATVGSYRYHLFTSSSTFVITTGSGDVEIAVIGAGGGGGRNCAGGGGGGAKEPASGYTTQTLSAGSYSVTIASGGAGSTNDNVKGGTPSATSFSGSSTITALGGGGGGSAGTTTGANGGSGGGAGSSGSVNNGGTASGSNTNAGGSSATGGNSGAGGGGGATATGGNGTSTTGGAGGQGLSLNAIDANLTSANFNTFSGMTVISSGGGGGTYRGGTPGTGGTGAGSGNGNTDATAASATSFGSGGGGGGNAVTGGSGGNGYGGLVIVRYAV